MQKPVRSIVSPGDRRPTGAIKVLPILSRVNGSTVIARDYLRVGSKKQNREERVNACRRQERNKFSGGPRFSAGLERNALWTTPPPGVRCNNPRALPFFSSADPRSGPTLCASKLLLIADHVNISTVITEGLRSGD